jgi:DNA-binding transcriptional regulator YiaG
MTDLDLSPAAIRECRLAAGLTQAEFAELIGVHEYTVRRWEHGQMRPNRLAVRALSQAMAEPMTPPRRDRPEHAPRRRPTP